MNYPIQIETENDRLRPDNSEVNRLYGCNKKIQQLTNWSPKYQGLEGFRNGLKITIDWFKDSQNLKLYGSEYLI